MIEINKINKEIYDLTKEFLLSVPSIDEVSDDVLANAVVLLDEKRVVGAVSYEKFNEYALVRYFIFKKTVLEDSIEKLFETLARNASNDHVSHLFSIVISEEVENLFETLGFSQANKEKIFIDEESVLLSKYKDALFMIRDL